MVYTGEEYFHYDCGTLSGCKDRRRGFPSQCYLTHSKAYYITVMGKRFTEISHMEMPSILEEDQEGVNSYK
jgi:hypothetical protein